MAYNIHWAKPEVTECWSFRGRLYQTYSTANTERNKQLKRIEDYARRWPDSDWVGRECSPVYKVTWIWEEER